MQSSTSGTGYRFVFGVGRILIVIVEGMLNAHVGIRAGENERSYCPHTTRKSPAKVPLGSDGRKRAWESDRAQEHRMTELSLAYMIALRGTGSRLVVSEHGLCRAMPGANATLICD